MPIEAEKQIEKGMKSYKDLKKECCRNPNKCIDQFLIEKSKQECKKEYPQKDSICDAGIYKATEETEEGCPNIK